MPTVCAEIDGNAQCCARLVHELRRGYQDLLIDQRGFLLIPEDRWEEVQRLAAKHDCEIRPAKRSQEAA